MQSSRSKCARSLSEDDAEIEGGDDVKIEEGDEGELEVGGHVWRGLGGKSDDGWSLDHEISGSMEELHGKLLEILHGLQDEIGVTHHPYKRAKRASGAKVDLGDFWHVKNGRKFGATLSCPFRCTTSSQFRIKYQIRNERLRIWTISKHTHENDIRVRGLSLDKASKVYEAVVNSPTMVKPRAIHIELNNSGDVHIESSL
mmetsp:Transcript_52036/g.108687  ORF Transcript_52036/g.108687 Transcript_52036/m.108687 type:complete len:200 (-) Transcript_52036:98-697(-)